MGIFLKLDQEFPKNRNGIKIIKVIGIVKNVIEAKIERGSKNSFMIQ